MTTITFDTLAYANRLKSAGMDSKVAETQAEVTAEIIKDLTDKKLATKEDVKNEIHLMKLEIKGLEMRLYSFIAKSVMFTVVVLGSLQTLFHFI